MNPYKIGTDMNSVQILWDVEPVMAWSPKVQVTNSLIGTVVLYMGLLQSYISNWSTLNYCLNKLVEQLRENHNLSYAEFLAAVYADFAETEGMEQEIECLDYHSFLNLSEDKCFRIIPKKGTCSLHTDPY